MIYLSIYSLLLPPSVLCCNEEKQSPAVRAQRHELSFPQCSAVQKGRDAG